MVEYRWKKYDPVNILNMELAEFDLTKTEYSIKDVEYVAGIDRCEFIKSTMGVGWPSAYRIAHRVHRSGVAGVPLGYSRSYDILYLTPIICILFQNNHIMSKTNFKIPGLLP